MIKNIWVVRSREKLFWGLTFAISGVMLGYTLLNLTVLTDTIPWRQFLFSPVTELSKYALLTLPILSFLPTILLWRFVRQMPAKAADPTISAEKSEKQKGFLRSTCVYGAFLLSLFFFFWQMDRLNTAKNLPGFPPFVPLALLAGLLIWLIVRLIQSRSFR